MKKVLVMQGQITFGEALRLMRVRKHLNYEELSALSGVSDNTLREMENDRANPRLATLQRVCEALGYEIRLGLRDEKDEKNPGIVGEGGADESSQEE